VTNCDQWQWLHHRIMSAFNTALPKEKKDHDHIYFDGKPEFFHILWSLFFFTMHCRFWNPQIQYNLMLGKVFGAWNLLFKCRFWKVFKKSFLKCVISQYIIWLPNADREELRTAANYNILLAINAVIPPDEALIDDSCYEQVKPVWMENTHYQLELPQRRKLIEIRGVKNSVRTPLQPEQLHNFPLQVCSNFMLFNTITSFAYIETLTFSFLAL